MPLNLELLSLAPRRGMSWCRRRESRATFAARLAEVATKQDHVVILLSGHGSRQPADEDPEDFEPDGFHGFP